MVADMLERYNGRLSQVEVLAQQSWRGSYLAAVLRLCRSLFETLTTRTPSYRCAGSRAMSSSARWTAG